MFIQPHPDLLRHARALFADGWRPHPSIQPEALLGRVRLRDTLQDVDVATWQAMHLMAAAQDPIRIRG